MNRPPRLRRARRVRDLTWSGPLASWTAQQTRRQHERNNISSIEPLVSLYLTQYFLLAIAIIFHDPLTTAGGPIDLELLRKLGSLFFTLSVNTAVFVGAWWFWPRLLRFMRFPPRPWTGPYPASRGRTNDAVVWSVPIVLTAMIAILFSPTIAGIAAVALIGMWLLLTGIRRRVGCDERCRCGYPVSTPRWSRDRCPECGRNLDHPRAVILGHDRRSTPRIATGLLLLAAAAAIMVALF